MSICIFPSSKSLCLSGGSGGDGTALPPLIIHKSKEVKEDYFQKIPEKHLVSVSGEGRDLLPRNFLKNG